MSKDFGNAGSHTEREFSNRYYGQVVLTPQVMSFVKGQSPTEYVPGVSPVSSRAECVNITVYPVVEMNSQFNYERRFTTGTREWIRIVLQSIEDVTGKTGNEALAAIDEKYIAMELVPTGKKYIKKVGGVVEKDENGQPIMKDELAPKFLAIFEDDVKAGEAYTLFIGAEPEADDPQVDQERETALKFLTAMVAAGIDVKPQFGTNPVLSCLNLEDADVQAIVAK